MNNNDGKGLATALAVFAAGLLVLLALPVRFTPSETVTGRVYAAAEWTLERSGRGEITGILRDRASGVSDAFLMQSVDRGDVARFEIVPHLTVGSLVEAGDTLGVLRSTASDRDAAALAALVAVAESEAATFAEGAKEPIIQAAERRLEQTRAMRDLQQRIVGRLDTLAGRAVVSLDEVERVRTELVALEGEIAVLEAELDVLRTGARPSERRLAQARLQAARRNVAALENQRSAFAAVSPIQGVVTRSRGDSVLVTVKDMERRIALVPVPVGFAGMIAEGDTLDSEEGWDALVLDVDPSVMPLAGGDVVIAAARVDGVPPSTPDGALINLRLKGTPETLRSRAWETVGSLFQWETWGGRASRN